MKTFFLVLAIVYLIVLEIARVYYIMPFPGSQQKETIDLAYWIHTNMLWLRILGWLVAGILLFQLLRQKKRPVRILAGTLLLLYAVVFYFFNFRMLADKMFIQPREKIFAAAASSTIAPDKLVIGVTIDGISKAYPIQVIGYHHQVRDTVGGKPVMVTYCTVCRTGRVFNPAVKGEPEEFRLVGMDHFNAMFEDSRTGSWWRQATGEAIAGPLKGLVLEEIPSRQTSVAAWVAANPSTQIMQYDPAFIREYEDLEDFDKGTIESSLEKRDSASWEFKSWVVGVSTERAAAAYDWNALVLHGYLEDSLPDMPVIVLLEKDSSSFHVFNRMQGAQSLHFKWDPQAERLSDRETGSSWNLRGECTDGPLKGMYLQRIQAYQEFWHSWQQFHPNTRKFPAG